VCTQEQLAHSGSWRGGGQEEEEEEEEDRRRRRRRSRKVYSKLTQ